MKSSRRFGAFLHEGRRVRRTMTGPHAILALGAMLALNMPAGARQSETSLIDAVRNGDTVVLSRLIDNGRDVNVRSGDLSTALLWASFRDDLTSVRMLLAAGADPNLANDLGVTPLWAAGQNGSDAIAALLLEAGADPNLALWSGETPLMVASRSGFPEVASQLLENGANAEARGTRDQTALMWAVAEKHPDVVKVLLEHGADVHARSSTWELVMAVPPHGYLEYNKAIPHGNDTALLFAAQVGDLDSARLLVEAGADVNDTNAWGVSATTLAGFSGFGDLVRFLLDNGADPNIDGPGFTALHTAIMRRDEGLVRDLLAHGADPNLPIGTWTPERRTSTDFHFVPELVGATPFWLAARLVEPGIMRLLAEHGADPLVVHRGEYVSALTADGPDFHANETTALMAALGMGRGTAWVDSDRSTLDARTMTAARLTLDLGVDVNFADTDGRTALDAASRTPDPALAYLLMAYGAKPGTAETAAGPRRGLPPQ